MLISKNGKRLMACVMSVAMLLASFIYVPKAADAAEKPTVTVLGATIRLSEDYDNAAGKQSMKMAIRVDNADNAKSCSIKLSLKGKDYIVSTKAEDEVVADGSVDQQISRLSAKGDNYVEYAVVVRDIPKEEFGSAISITGYADVLDGTAEEIPSTSESRSVSDVVNSLIAEHPGLDGLKLDENGVLVKSNGQPLTAYDVAHDSGEEAVYEVNKEFTNNDTGLKWDSVGIGNIIQIKKTDIVKVVLSSTDESVGDFTIGLSNSDKDIATNVLQEASLSKYTNELGEITLDVVPNFFQHNVVDISKVALTIPEGKTIKVEKIIVTPTDEIALSVLGLTTTEIGTDATLTAEIEDEDSGKYNKIEWTSSKADIASVKQDQDDPKKAIVSGVAEGETDISVKLFNDANLISEEKIKFTVTKKIYGVTFKFDLSQLPSSDYSENLLTNECCLLLPDNLTLQSGQKVKITFNYEIPTDGHGIRAYLSDAGKNLQGDKSWDIPEPGENGEASITTEATAETNHLTIKGLGYGIAPKIKLNGITLEFVPAES